MLAVSAMAGSQLLVMQYLQAVLGLAPLVAGLWTAPSIVLGIAATLVAPKAVQYVRPADVVGAGLLLAAVGAAILVVTAQQMSLVWTVLGFTVLYLGVTPTLALTTDLVVGSAPRERAGMASGVAESGAEFGLAAGIAFIGTAATSIYQSRLSANAPEKMSASDLEEASETVGKAVAMARAVPGDDLLEARPRRLRQRSPGGDDC